MLLYRQPSHGTETHTTPTSVLDTNTTPDPLINHPRYVKVAELGLGSSAFVLLAEDTKRKKDVAIKFINRGSNRCEKVSTCHCQSQAFMMLCHYVETVQAHPQALSVICMARAESVERQKICHAACPMTVLVCMQHQDIRPRDTQSAAVLQPP